MRVVRKIGIAALLCLPTVASGLETTEDLLWPADGRFTGYPRETEPRPVQFSVSGGLYHDSNVFRLSDGAPLPAGVTDKSDSIYRVGLGLKANLPISRQHLLLDAKIDNYSYDRNSQLDNVAYQAGAAWRWQVGSPLSGDVGYTRQRYLGDLGEVQASLRDMVTQDRFYATAGYLVTPRWRVRGGADWTKWDHSEVTRDVLDLRVSSTTVGLDYITPANNSIGGQFKYSHGNYPNRQLFAGSAISNDYDEYETSAVLHWVLTGKTEFNARLGYTKREHDEVPARDFGGGTGRLSLDWAPGGKTLINASVWREIYSVEERGTLGEAGLEQAAASYVISSGASIGPTWAPTVKLVFQGKLVHEKRKYEGDPGIAFGVAAVAGAPGAHREDTFNGLRLSAGYTPIRALRLSLSAEHGKRDSNAFLRDYDYNLISSNARFQF
jgi:exopolysaccharide biosynthesis operon protein EpsL